MAVLGKLRIEYPGAIYHLINRGDQREDIFKDDADRERFVGTLAEACRKTEWQVHANCLMRNHFHLVIETPQPNLVFRMKWLEFRKELLAAATEQVGPNHHGSDRRESAEQKARRIVSDGLKLLGWDQASLESFPKGHTGKVELARQLRSETTMSLKWIAQELKMGSWTYVSNLLIARNAEEFK